MTQCRIALSHLASKSCRSSSISLSKSSLWDICKIKLKNNQLNQNLVRTGLQQHTRATVVLAEV